MHGNIFTLEPGCVYSGIDGKLQQQCSMATTLRATAMIPLHPIAHGTMSMHLGSHQCTCCLINANATTSMQPGQHHCTWDHNAQSAAFVRQVGGGLQWLFAAGYFP